MSTSYDIFPTSNYMPGSEEIIALSQRYFEKYLRGQDIVLPIKVRTEKFITSDSKALPVCRKEGEKEPCLAKKGMIAEEKLLIHDEDGYEAFSVNHEGQAFVFFYRDDELNRESWNEEISSNPRAMVLKNAISRNQELGYYWNVKRTMGQPAVVNIYYGFLAIAITELTEGIIYSDDGAWEYQCFPTTSKEFLEKYMDLSGLQDSNMKYFFMKNLSKLQEQSGNVQRTKKIKLTVQRRKCSKCGYERTEYFMSDHSYGERLVCSKDGSICMYADLLEENETDELAELIGMILQDRNLSVSKYKLAGFVSSIYWITCDHMENNGTSVDWKICPNCLSEDVREDEEYGEQLKEMEIPYVTHHAWRAMGAERKKECILSALFVDSGSPKELK